MPPSGGLELAVRCTSLHCRLEVYACRCCIKPPWDHVENEARQRIGPLTGLWYTPGVSGPTDQAQLVMEVEQINH